jgi:CRISPR-associated endonuclease Cas1
LRNSRTLLRRNAREDSLPETALAGLRRAARAVDEATGPAELLGVEGNGAAFTSGALPPCCAAAPTMSGADCRVSNSKNRNRRPATDPVNAMLSFAYAMLVRELTATLSAIGFDPYRGFYHQPRYGRRLWRST